MDHDDELGLHRTTTFTMAAPLPVIPNMLLSGQRTLEEAARAELSAKAAGTAARRGRTSPGKQVDDGDSRVEASCHSALQGIAGKNGSAGRGLSRVVRRQHEQAAFVLMIIRLAGCVSRADPFRRCGAVSCSRQVIRRYPGDDDGYRDSIGPALSGNYKIGNGKGWAKFKKSASVAVSSRRLAKTNLIVMKTLEKGGYDKRQIKGSDAALSKVRDAPIGDIEHDRPGIDDQVSFTVMLTTPACPLRNQIEQEARQAVSAIAGVGKVEIKFDASVPNDGRARGLLRLPIRNAIAVASGKGGVGKSTVAVNVAVVLAESGARVGLLDADIYGPNIPTMMGVKGLPPAGDNKLVPAEAYGVKMMSIGFLVRPGQPLIWRGPMLHSAIRQFLSDVEWGELDYLVVDLPPGRGCGSQFDAIHATQRGHHRHPAAASFLGGCPAWPGDVPPAERTGFRRGGKYELPGAAGRNAHGCIRNRRRGTPGSGKRGAFHRCDPDGSSCPSGR
jgi:hypothetical protein